MATVNQRTHGAIAAEMYAALSDYANPITSSSLCSPSGALARGGMVARGHDRRDRRAVTRRADLQAAAQLPEALAHPGDAHPQIGSACGGCIIQRAIVVFSPILGHRGWHPFATVLNA